MVKKPKAGGARPGAGRPKGTGRYREPTSAIRVPVSMLSEIKQLLALKQQYGRSGHIQAANRPFSPVPFFSARVAAGGPVEATDHIEAHVDLHDYLVSSSSQVFMLRAKGDSMIDAGIYEDDLLIVDRSIAPQDGKIVIARLDGEFTVKRLRTQEKKQWLVPENANYSPISLEKHQDCEIIGVVIHVIHSF